MHNSSNITAIILAAGEGKRIGYAKWRIKFKKFTFLDIIVKKLFFLGIKRIICVSRFGDLPKNNFITVVVNQNPECGMFSSIYYGIKKFQNSLGYLIFPVDHPFVKLDTLNKMINCFSMHPYSVISPIFHKKSGHPIIIPNKIARKIISYDYNYSGGLRKFIFDNNINIYKMNISDKYILCNINNINDLHNLGII